MPLVSQRIPVNPRDLLDYRDENMIEMEVSCRPLNQPLPNGQMASNGEKKKILIYESQEQAVLDLLEKNLAGIEQAEKHFQQGLEDHLAGFVKDNDIKNATEADWKKARETFQGSVPASYREIFKTDILPLIEAKTLRRDLPPPQKKQSVREQEAFAEKLIPALAKIFADRDEKMLEKMAEVAANTVRAVIEETTPKKKNN